MTSQDYHGILLPNLYYRNTAMKSPIRFVLLPRRVLEISQP